MTSDPLIEAILVHYGNTQPTGPAIESLAQSRQVEIGLSLVDNGPAGRPETLGEIVASNEEALAGGITLLASPRNLGFFGGVNFALSRSANRRQPDYYFLMNHDIRLAPEALAFLVDCLVSRPRAAAIGPLLLFEAEAGRVWNGGSDIEWPAARPRSRYHGEDANRVPSEAYPVGYLAGCAMLLSRKTVESLAPLNEDYFLYFEDAELGEQIREAGKLSYVEPRARVWHAAGSAVNACPDEALYYRTRNRILFSRRWSSAGIRAGLARRAYALRKLFKGGVEAAAVRDAWRGSRGIRT